MALTLNGSTEWPSAKDLTRFRGGEIARLATPDQSDLGTNAEAISDTASQVRAAIKSTRQFREFGERLLSEWEIGITAIRA